MRSRGCRESLGRFVSFSPSLGGGRARPYCTGNARPVSSTQPAISASATLTVSSARRQYKASLSVVHTCVSISAR